MITPYESNDEWKTKSVSSLRPVKNMSLKQLPNDSAFNPKDLSATLAITHENSGDSHDDSHI